MENTTSTSQHDNYKMLELGCLMPLSTIFQLYGGGK